MRFVYVEDLLARGGPMSFHASGAMRAAILPWAAACHCAIDSPFTIGLVIHEDL
jgi:hypothetical protein